MIKMEYSIIDIYVDIDDCHPVSCLTLTRSPDGPLKPGGPLAPGIPCKQRTVQMLQSNMKAYQR